MNMVARRARADAAIVRGEWSYNWVHSWHNIFTVEQEHGAVESSYHAIRSFVRAASNSMSYLIFRQIDYFFSLLPSLKTKVNVFAEHDEILIK